MRSILMEQSKFPNELLRTILENFLHETGSLAAAVVAAVADEWVELKRIRNKRKKHKILCE